MRLMSFIATAFSFALPPLIRIASPYNRTATELVTDAVNTMRVGGRLYRPIGSAHKKTLGVDLENWYHNTATSTAGPGGPLNNNGIFLELNGISNQLFFGPTNSPTPVMTDGQYGLMSNLRPIEDWGLTKTNNRGLACRIRIEQEAPVGSGIPVAGAVDLLDVCRKYDASVSCTNLGGTGALTFSGSTTATTVPNVHLIGEDTIPSVGARVLAFLVDSIAWASSSASYASGAMEGANVANQLISGIIIGRAGNSAQSFANDTGRIMHLIELVDGVVSGTGTNDASTTSAVVMRSRERSIWAKCRAFASKHPLARALFIFRVPLGMKTTGDASSLAGQTVSDPLWDAGGVAEQFNDLMAAEEGVPGGCDKFCANFLTSPYLIRGSASGKGTPGSDHYKFHAPPTITTDKIHFLAAGANGVDGAGANLRVDVLANS